MPFWLFAGGDVGEGKGWFGRVEAFMRIFLVVEGGKKVVMM